MRSRWPNIPAERLLDLTQAWGVQEGARIVAVFDGRAPDERAGVTVVGTGPEIADDWIAEHARELAQDGHRVWLVSSDRGLRERVAGHVERVIGGGSFAGRLEALAREDGGTIARTDGGDDH
jgi:YacP-like NYN domain